MLKSLSIPCQCLYLCHYWDFPGGSVCKESACHVGNPGLIPGWGSPLEKSMATHSSIFMPGEFHGQKSLVGYSPWGHKESDMTEVLTQHNLLPCWLYKLL